MTVLTYNVEGSSSVNFFDKKLHEFILPAPGIVPGSTYTITCDPLTYSGANQIGFEVRLKYAQPVTSWCAAHTFITPSGNPTQAVSYTGPANPSLPYWGASTGSTGCMDFTTLQVVVFDYLGSGHRDITWRVTLSYDAPSGQPCEYGTELKPGIEGTMWLTFDVLVAALFKFNIRWALSLFVDFITQPIDLNALCGTGPPTIPADPKTEDLWKSIEYRRDLLGVVLWHQYCQCKAGATTPTPYPPPAWVQPPNWPNQIPIVCSNDDLCAAMVRVLEQLAAIQRQVGQLQQMTTLLQRYELPMATVPGSRHPPLIGRGSFNVARLVGVRVLVTQSPAGGRELEGYPPYVWDLGWMSISDRDGMIAEKRISQKAMTWLPDQMPLALEFGYDLRPGVTVEFLELKPEP